MKKIAKFIIVVLLLMLTGGVAYWYGTTTAETISDDDTDETNYVYYITDLDIDELDYIDQEQFYETIYVSKEGDNSNGETWDTAYTNPVTAYSNVLSDLDYRTLIMMGPGEYNINQDDRLEIEKNVFWKGSGRDLTIITNTHENAEWVFQAEEYFRCEDLTIKMENNVSGIFVEEDADIHLNHLRFDGFGATGGEALRIYANLGEYEDLIFNSYTQNQQGIVLYNASYNLFKFNRFLSYNTSILIEDCSSYNHFIDTYISNSTFGFYINDGNSQVITTCEFTGNGRNIADSVGNHVYNDLYDPLAEEFMIIPALAGQMIPCGVAAAYGADTEIYATANALNPYKVVGVIVKPNSTDLFSIRLSYNAGTRFFFESPFQISNITETHRMDIDTPTIFNAGVRISGSARNLLGFAGVETWLQIIEY